LGMYALFVSFFPQLVAGPIERSVNLLPQFRVHHKFDISKIESGLKQMVWGYFMKLVIADRLALLVNAVYGNVGQHNGTTLLIATVFFAFQIYCDFAGYSNIAIGAARMMGFELMVNFDRPYFSSNISEFWRRWHISLSTWFRDYLYIPLGGNRVDGFRKYFNIFITFFISGIWHGANWTFVIWGALHGVYIIIQKFFGFDSIKISRFSIKKLVLILVNFFLVVLAWVFFRANTVSDAYHVLFKIFTFHDIPFKDGITTYIYGVFGIFILIFKEAYEEYFSSSHGRIYEHKNSIFEAFVYACIIGIILTIGVFDNSQFIYFQF
jgi:alginate O-acetyltransferase complex protein AlgI